MEKVLNVAAYIFEKYRAISNTTIDEMKLHKLLYFAQRQSLALNKEPLFNEDFEGWRYGPVCVDVRRSYTVDSIMFGISTELSENSIKLLDDVIDKYGAFEAWKLSEITHNEISWLKSRRGLKPDENGNNVLEKDDIAKDAEESIEKEFDLQLFAEYDKEKDNLKLYSHNEAWQVLGV